MGKQEGIIPITGTFDKLTFVKTKDGFLVRKKSSIDSQRFATDPAFERVRENGAEFSRAGKATKVLLDALKPLLKKTADRRVTSRLTRDMMKVVKADKTSSRGFRNVLDGEVALLEGFEFNIGSALGTSLFVQLNATIDRLTGKLTAQLPSFIPTDLINAPQGATHYRILSAGVEADFEKGTNVTAITVSDNMPLDKSLVGDITLINTVTPNSTHPLLLMLGIEYGQEVNGRWYDLKDMSFNAMAIVKVNTGV
jgi:hypothetical protein